MVKKIDQAEGRRAFAACISALNTSSHPPFLGGESTSPSTEENSKPAPALTGQNALPREILATAVRWSLQELAQRAPGRSVEVRVPPFAAVQILEGTTHRRGTPPAVIEMPPKTWFQLAEGSLTWEDALKTGSANASGQRADLSSLLPLFDNSR